MSFTLKRRTALAAAALVPLAITTSCAANTEGGGSPDGEGLEIVSWWTSGSEAEALQVLFDAMQEHRSELNIVNAAVSGGGGSNAQQSLNARLQAGDPPAAWQLHPDGQLKSFVEGGQVADVTQLWQDNDWEKDVPADVLDVQKVDGAYYTVPIGVHRGNVLWTNPKVLEEAGVVIDESMDLAGLMEAFRALHEADVVPLLLGDKDIFAASQVIESVIIAEIGPAKWQQLFTGELAFDASEVQSAVEIYVELLGMVNSDHSALTWDEAASRMADGGGAATLMGDWAYGEIAGAGNEPGTDFSWVPFPSAEPTFVYVGDGFSIPAANNPNEEASQEFLEVLMDPQVQTDFAAVKGSIPALISADVSTLSEYQQSASDSFTSDAVVSSIAHAQAAGAEFAQTFADAVTTLNGNQSVEAFTSTLTDAQQNLLS
ncbi:ABC transporter substrate-binding protein [Brachybacterium sp.]|uniref:ABC transporter substrate-binding protein n=1 Tax=Brachybacterium sp. TaxID=1891286 RepID=UPI003F92F9C4